MAPLPESGASRQSMDSEGRLGSAPGVAGDSGIAPLDRAGSMVALWLRSLVVAQWRRLLCLDLRFRALAATRPYIVGGFSKCRLGRASIPIARLSSEPGLDRLQRPAAPGLLCHGVHRCAACVRYGPASIAGGVKPFAFRGSASQSSAGAIHTFPSAVLVSCLYVPPHRDDLYDGTAHEPQPHHAGARERRVERFLGVPRMDG